MPIHPINAKQLVRLIEERNYFRNEEGVAAALATGGAAAAAIREQRENLAEHILYERIGVNHDDPESEEILAKMQLLHPGVKEKEQALSGTTASERWEDQKEQYTGILQENLRLPKPVLEEQLEQDEAVMRGIITRILDEKIKPREVMPCGLVRWNEREEIAADVLDETIDDLQLLLANKRLLTGRGAGLDSAINAFLEEVKRIKQHIGGDGVALPDGYNLHKQKANRQGLQHDIATMDGEELLNAAIDEVNHPLRISKAIRRGSEAEAALRTAREDLAYSMIASVQEEMRHSKTDSRRAALVAVDKTLPDVPEFGLRDTDSVVPIVRDFHSRMGREYGAYAGLLGNAQLSDDAADRQFRHDYGHLRRAIKDIITGKIHAPEIKRLDISTHVLDELVDHVNELRTSGQLSQAAVSAADTLIEKLPAVRPALEKIELGQDRRGRK